MCKKGVLCEGGGEGLDGGGCKGLGGKDILTEDVTPADIAVILRALDEKTCRA